MFESICIRQRSKASLGQPIDLGPIAEALLFYGNVRVIANTWVLDALLKSCTPEVLIELLESDYLKLAYEANELGIKTEGTNTTWERHEPIYYSVPRLQLQEYLPKLLEQTTGKRGRGRRIAARIARKVEVIEYDSSIIEEALVDLADTRTVARAVRTLIETYVPEYPLNNGFVFNVRREGARLVVETNLDFQMLNAYYHKRISESHSSLSPAYLLAHLMSVKGDLFFASKYASEIAVDDVNAMLIRANIEDAFSRLTGGQRQAALFQDFVFDDSRAVAEAIRAGERNFKDLLSILPKAKRFHEWLQSQPPDQDIVKAYFQEVTKTTWVDKLPAKSIRWLVFTAAGIGADALGAGGLGTAVGVGLGATDTFVLDKILKGWKPNQFVDTSLRKFVSRETSLD